MTTLKSLTLGGLIILALAVPQCALAMGIPVFVPDRWPQDTVWPRPVPAPPVTRGQPQ